MNVFIFTWNGDAASGQEHSVVISRPAILIWHQGRNIAAATSGLSQERDGPSGTSSGSAQHPIIGAQGST